MTIDLPHRIDRFGRGRGIHGPHEPASIPGHSVPERAGRAGPFEGTDPGRIRPGLPALRHAPARSGRVHLRVQCRCSRSTTARATLRLRPPRRVTPAAPTASSSSGPTRRSARRLTRPASNPSRSTRRSRTARSGPGPRRPSTTAEPHDRAPAPMARSPRSATPTRVRTGIHRPPAATFLAAAMGPASAITRPSTTSSSGSSTATHGSRRCATSSGGGSGGLTFDRSSVMRMEPVL